MDLSFTARCHYGLPAHVYARCHGYHTLPVLGFAFCLHGFCARVHSVAFTFAAFTRTLVPALRVARCVAVRCCGCVLVVRVGCYGLPHAHTRALPLLSFSGFTAFAFRTRFTVAPHTHCVWLDFTCGCCAFTTFAFTHVAVAVALRIGLGWHWLRSVAFLHCWFTFARGYTDFAAFAYTHARTHVRFVSSLRFTACRARGLVLCLFARLRTLRARDLSYLVLRAVLAAFYAHAYGSVPTVCTLHTTRLPLHAAPAPLVTTLPWLVYRARSHTHTFTRLDYTGYAPTTRVYCVRGYALTFWFWLRWIPLRSSHAADCLRFPVMPQFGSTSDLTRTFTRLPRSCALPHMPHAVTDCAFICRTACCRADYTVTLLPLRAPAVGCAFAVTGYVHLLRSVDFARTLFLVLWFSFVRATYTLRFTHVLTHFTLRHALRAVAGFGSLSRLRCARISLWVHAFAFGSVTFCCRARLYAVGCMVCTTHTTHTPPHAPTHTAHHHCLPFAFPHIAPNIVTTRLFEPPFNVSFLWTYLLSPVTARMLMTFLTTFIPRVTSTPVPSDVRRVRIV